MIFNRKRNTADSPDAADDLRGDRDDVRAIRSDGSDRQPGRPFGDRTRNTAAVSDPADDLRGYGDDPVRGYGDEPVARRSSVEDRPASRAYDDRGRRIAQQDARGHHDERSVNRTAVEERPSRPASDDDRSARDDVRHRDDRVANRSGVTDRPAPVATPTPEPKAERAARDASAASAAEERAALFSEHDASDLKRRWSDIQAGFIDEPRRAVEHADSLVADVMKRLTDGFANERGSLGRQWGGGDKITTEDLRVALRRYRSFFDRLLSA
jgi:hypothetical protein